MKFLIIILVASFPFIVQASEVTFIGKIKNNTSTEVNFVIQNSNSLEEAIIYKARINETNEFSIVLPIHHPQIIKIESNGQALHLFASPKTGRLEFEFDNNEPSRTLKLKGKSVANNSFYNSFARSYKWHQGKLESYEMGGMKSYVSSDIKQKAISYSMLDYFRILDQDRMSQIKYLENSTGIDIDFYRYIANEINWRYETNKMAYFLFNKDRYNVHEIKRYWVRYALLQTTDINDDKAVAYSSYQNMLTAFIHFLHLQTPVDKKIAESYHTFIEVNLRGKPRYYMLAKLMLDNYRTGGNTVLASQKLKAFKRENPYKEFNTTLDNIFGKESQYLAQKNAPNLKVLKLDEQEIWLNEYSGKVVYVSFWASWCAPCLKSFRDSRSFRQELKNQGVVFLNINIDDREDIWRSSLARHDIIGTNVYGLDLKQARDELKITSLPYYFLMNKSGKISYLSSSKLQECRDDFYQLLKE